MKRCLVLCLVLCLLAGCAAGNTPAGTGKALCLAKAGYPQLQPFPKEEDYQNKETGEMDYDAYDRDFTAWSQSQKELRENLPEGYSDGLTPFFERSAKEFLQAEEGKEGENMVYSPLNLYFALSMLAETTGGNTREEILGLLGSGSVEALREKTEALWRANYSDDGRVTQVLANSIWLNEDLSYHQETLDLLAGEHHASSFSGKMGSEELDRALQEWINEQTGGLLKEAAKDVKTDPLTVTALVSTLYFKAGWADEFSPELTEEQVFHAPTGEERCPFLKETQESGTLYVGDRFSAVKKRMSQGEMKFLLPDEGVTAESLLEDPQVMKFFFSQEEWEKTQDFTIHFALPKFDISSQLDLCSGLKALGVTEAFDMDAADFSPLTDTPQTYLSKAQHSARVMVDEEGCAGAAYTVLLMECGAALPEEKEEIDFILDRPFLFSVSGIDGLPLFVGVVRHPVS